LKEQLDFTMLHEIVVLSVFFLLLSWTLSLMCVFLFYFVNCL
jgi:hypothetical protein